MSARVSLVGLLAVVAASAAVLSFAALRDLARTCGFGAGQAWLLPVVVDAGAAAGSLVWLGEGAGTAARQFARALALSLLGLSVAANALGHGLTAYQLAPPWWIVAVVSAIAPAVLGAVVHLAVLVGRHGGTDATLRGLVGDQAADAACVVPVADDARAEPGSPDDTAPAAGTAAAADAAAELIAAGAGRRRLARELAITEHEARRLLDRSRRHPGLGETGGEARVGERELVSVTGGAR